MRVLLISVALLLGAAAAAVRPDLPRAQVDAPSVPSGRTHPVRAGGNFQAALDAAAPGDVIVLEAGATFVGPFTLPLKRGSEWITIRTSASEPPFPPPGTRVGPAHAPSMPKLVAGSGSVISTAAGAHHFHFVGVEIRPRDGVFLYNLIQLGANERSLDVLPHHIVFDRCYLHGDPIKGTRRGVAMNGVAMAVIDSHLSDFKEVGADSQAIAGWSGPGPFRIVNNYLEGAGENVLFGGADPTIRDLVPSDIEIRRNRFAKPLAWKMGASQYAGTPWTVKNLFELKNAQRVLIDGNIFEHNWSHAQTGFAILFTVRNQDKGAPWSVVQDITFTNNIVRSVARGVNITGADDIHPSQPTRRILIRNNVFDGVEATWLQMLGPRDVAVDHNTIQGNPAGHVILADGGPSAGFVFTNNLSPHKEYGVFGSGVGSGNSALAAYFPGAVFDKNVLVGGVAASYPRGNFFPASAGDVRFTDLASGNYRLAATSPYRRAGTDGKDIGADLDAITAAQSASGSSTSAPAARRSAAAALKNPQDVAARRGSSR